ncbi:hypothetical protein SAMN04489842_2884 [Natronobacterium texcoconense]|uniref:Uncharacterized protein n=2 Tax=Natronobacterium texcoconense TaxID=1095778 RepID=A0A1H1HNH5_NATTX|nr:hypothetical protein SAMN04489842_2884 [Natronobacterium texcoconense]
MGEPQGATKSMTGKKSYDIFAAIVAGAVGLVPIAALLGFSVDGYISILPEIIVMALIIGLVTMFVGMFGRLL